MEVPFVIFLTLFFVFVISILIMLFGDPRYIFADINFETTSTRSSIITNEAKQQSYPRMPSPPAHITKDFHRAPSLNSPYPSNPPPLGFEYTAQLPDLLESSSADPLPYPIGEIQEMPRPMDTYFFPLNPPNNEWSYIEEQIVRDVASDIHPPSYDEVVNDSPQSSLQNHSKNLY